jgi:hypothetical protein
MTAIEVLGKCEDAVAKTRVKQYFIDRAGDGGQYFRFKHDLFSKTVSRNAHSSGVHLTKTHYDF